MTGLSQKDIDSYEEFWKLADKDKDGQLTIQELAKAVRSYKKNATDSEIAGMFCCIDGDDSKRISKKEFLNAMTEKKKRSKAIMDLFKKYDADGNNVLSRGEVIKMIKDCFPADKVNYIIGQFLSYSDLDGNGQVTFQEFSSYFG